MNCFNKLNMGHVKSVSRLFKYSETQQNVCSSIWTGRKSEISNQTSFQTNLDLHEHITSAHEDDISKDVLSRVNTQIKEKSHGRLFAVIKLCDRKFKITAEDIISIGAFFPAKVGERICLEKVLAIGSRDFTLLGRPLLSKDLFRIEATVIEKTYIVPRPLFRFGLHYRRLHWFRTPYVLFQINSIEFTNNLDDLPSVENLQNRVIY